MLGQVPIYIELCVQDVVPCSSVFKPISGPSFCLSPIKISEHFVTRPSRSIALEQISYIESAWCCELWTLQTARSQLKSWATALTVVNNLLTVSLQDWTTLSAVPRQEEQFLTETVDRFKGCQVASAATVYNLHKFVEKQTCDSEGVSDSWMGTHPAWSTPDASCVASLQQSNDGTSPETRGLATTFAPFPTCPQCQIGDTESIWSHAIGSQAHIGGTVPPIRLLRHRK